MNCVLRKKRQPLRARERLGRKLIEMINGNGILPPSNHSGNTLPFDDELSDATLDHRRICQIILDHPGHKNAISKRKLVEMTGLHERRVREIIHELRIKCGKKIGSSCAGRSGGYFWIIDSEDEAITNRTLVAHGATTLAVQRSLQQTTSREAVTERQPELFAVAASAHGPQRALNFGSPSAERPAGCYCDQLRQAGSRMRCERCERRAA